MKELDPGHQYALDSFDGDHPQIITFMKRKQFPPNDGNQAGTNCQELLRVLIARTLYLDAQDPWAENQIILNSLRAALLAFEVRAATRHGRTIAPTSYLPEREPTGEDGHFIFSTPVGSEL